jgi:homogentisate 1,2-dioxygenase
MTEPYHCHFHPNSDETFLVIEGRLSIEFESGSLELNPGQLLTIPRGVRHRARPVGESDQLHIAHWRSLLVLVCLQITGAQRSMIHVRDAPLPVFPLEQCCSRSRGCLAGLTDSHTVLDPNAAS